MGSWNSTPRAMASPPTSRTFWFVAVRTEVTIPEIGRSAEIFDAEALRPGGLPTGSQVCDRLTQGPCVLI